MRQDFTGSTGHHICTDIIGMGNRIAHPLEERFGLRNILRQGRGDRLRLLDNGGRLPINYGSTLEIVGEMLRLQLHGTPPML